LFVFSSAAGITAVVGAEIGEATGVGKIFVEVGAPPFGAPAGIDEFV
jgi:hypothetical protein